MLFHPHAISIGILSNMTPHPKKKKLKKVQFFYFELKDTT